MRFGFTIEVEPVAVESPRLLRIMDEPTWVRQVDEGEFSLTEGRVGVPKPFVAAEVGEPGVDAHPGARADEQRVRTRDGL